MEGVGGGYFRLHQVLFKWFVKYLRFIIWKYKLLLGFCLLTFTFKSQWTFQFVKLSYMMKNKTKLESVLSRYLKQTNLNKWIFLLGEEIHYDKLSFCIDFVFLISLAPMTREEARADYGSREGYLGVGRNLEHLEASSTGKCY